MCFLSSSSAHKLPSILWFPTVLQWVMCYKSFLRPVCILWKNRCVSAITSKNHTLASIFYARILTPEVKLTVRVLENIFLGKKVLVIINLKYFTVKLVSLRHDRTLQNILFQYFFLVLSTSPLLFTSYTNLET